jgi:hypothetical protein
MSAMTPTPPVIPGYTVHGLLGRGGMAEVWLATQDSLQRKVAVKLLLDDADDSFTRRFIREAHTVASLRHPAIITIHDINRLPDGRPYLAMEFVGGGDLTQFRGHPLPPERALAILRQVAEGLAVVHDRGLIHRDIKPANLLCRDADQVVISDFGIAKDLRVDSELTQAGVAVGSPAYSSPEQAQCLTVDRRTDLYSLGVILLELLTGRNPYKADSYAQTVANHLHLPPPTLPPELRHLQALLQRLLARNPDDRFPDCRALLAALDRLPSAPRLPLAARLGGFRHRGWLFAAFLAIGLAASWPSLARQVTLWRTLHAAEQHLEAGRLVTPARDNAQLLYQEVLRLDPGNTRALAGLERVKQARIAQWLTLAEQRFAENRLAQPANDNAIHYFGQVLTLAKDHPPAKQGLQRIAAASLGLAKDALERRDVAEARRQIATGLLAAPDHAGLKALQDQLREPAKPKADAAAPRKAAPKSSPIKRFFKKLWG